MTGHDTGRPSWSLLGEAGLALCVASALIRLSSFPRAARWALGGRRGLLARHGDIASVVRAVEAWSRRVPWRSMCLEQGLATSRLLDRRAILLTINYGAAMVDGVLKAHVWVMSGDIPVTGCENAADFALLSQFSNDSSS